MELNHTLTSLHSSCKGCLDRGLLWAYDSLFHMDVPQERSFMGWGTYLIVSEDLHLRLDAIMHSSPWNSKWKIIENLSGSEFLVTSLTNSTRGPFLINPGPTPACISWAEVLPSPFGNWYHFQDARIRNGVIDAATELYASFPSLKIYYVLSFYPSLQTFYIMNNEELKEVEKQYESINSSISKKRKLEQEEKEHPFDVSSVQHQHQYPYNYQTVPDLKKQLDETTEIRMNKVLTQLQAFQLLIDYDRDAYLLPDVPKDSLVIMSRVQHQDVKSVTCEYCHKMTNPQSSYIAMNISTLIIKKHLILCMECVNRAKEKGWEKIEMDKMIFPTVPVFRWSDFIKIMKST